MPTRELDRLCADVMELTRQPELSVIQRRATRRRRRRVALASAGLAAVVAAVGGLTVDALSGRHGTPDVTGSSAAPNVTPSEWVPFAWGPVAWVDTADGTHVYAELQACGACARRLVGSDDGGRTWTTRAELTEMEIPQLFGATTLEMAGPTPKISTDGGRTWSPRVDDPTPAATVPAGGWLECGGSLCTLQVVDPATSRWHPLAAPPPLDVKTIGAVPTAAGLWLTGLDPTTRAPSVAVSRDGGATWTVRPIAPPAGDTPPIVATYDGTTAYAILGLKETSHGYRTTDGGRSWQPINGGAQLPSPCPDPPSVVLRDGTHVLQCDGGPRVGVDGGARYVAGQLPDWPGTVQVTRSGGFFSYRGGTLSVSSDGRHWTKVTPRW
jgi:hypothetical protein